jgi:hypothetical protein
MMSGLAEAQSLLDELKSMLASKGVNTDPPNPAERRASIIEVEGLLAERQLELHPHVRWFWETWPPSASEIVHPGFTDPAFAAEIMKDRSQLPFLIPIGYGSHRDLLVDLIPAELGPGIYVHDYFDDHGIQLIFAGFADLLRYLIAFFDDVRDDPQTGEDVESPFDLVASRSRLVALLPPSLADDERRPITEDVNTWPRRWRESRNLGEDVAALRGPTHTVAELISARQRGPVEATLVGTVKNLGGSSEGAQVRLSDHTGSVELRVLPDAPRFGWSPTDTYELDVIADKQAGPERSIDEFQGDHLDVSRLAQSGFFIDAIEAARDMVARGLGEHLTGGAPIRAIAMRPVD